MSLTPRADAWLRAGEIETFNGRRIFIRERDGSGPPVLLLHGYPSSSYDWREQFELLAARHLIAFDFLGFGLSEKPPEQVYSLNMQADLVESIVARRGGAEPIALVAHDMGTSVATELLARDREGKLPFALRSVLLFNGSMVLERASLTISQKLLRSSVGPLAARLSNERSFKAQFARIFSPAHPLSDEEAADQWSLLAFAGGNRIIDKLTFYLHERMTFAKRWHGALREWPGRLELAWAGLDPVCTEAVLQAVLELRPSAPLTRFPELGHYPQLEDPPAVAATIDGHVSS
jgi:pimeloyl-ACP methyl ester carboxylesterase